MDVRFVMPVYRAGRLFCWLSNTGHWPDIGGSVPGGFSAAATAVEQEGLRLPPVKLFKRGALDREIYAIITSNIRIADQRIGDIRAQAAALMVGQDRLVAVLDRYGDDTVTAAIVELRRRAAEQMRRPHRRNPGRDLSLERLRRFRRRRRTAVTIALAVEKTPDRTLVFDFAGTQPALRRTDEQRAGDDLVVGLSGGPPHFPRRADQRRRLRAADRAARTAPSSMRIIRRPVSGCAAEVSQRIAEAVFAALVQAIPG